MEVKLYQEYRLQKGDSLMFMVQPKTGLTKGGLQ